MAWQNSTGAIKGASTGRYHRFGLVGSGDIISCSPSGQFFCIECKTGSAIQSRAQKNFEKSVLKRNGIYIVVRSLEDLIEKIQGNNNN